MSAWIIRTTLAFWALKLSGYLSVRHSQGRQDERIRTRIGSGSKQSLFFTCERTEFHISVELDALASNGSCDRKNASRPRAIVVSAWGSSTPE